jgi:von Willebrand factor type A domain
MVSLLAFVGYTLAADPVEPSTVFGKEVTDFTFVVDSSQGLLPTAESLRAPIAGLIGVLPEGDRVALIAFHTRATTVLTPTEIDAENRQSLMDQVKGIPFPSAKETDLGSGAAEALERMSRKGAAPIQHIVVISDFCHNPSVQSPYDSGGRGCRSIRGSEGLARRFRENSAGKRVIVDYVQVTRTGSTSSRSPTELQPVLGAGSVEKDAVAFLSRAQTELPRFRYRPVAEALLAAAQVAVTVDSPGSPTRAARLALSLPPGISGTLDSLRASSGALSSSSVALEPAGVLELELERPARVPFAILPREEKISTSVTLEGELRLEPAAAWTALGLDPVRKGLRWTVNVPGSYTVGSWQRTGMMAVVVIASGAAVWGLRRLRRVPPRLGGSFSWRRGGDTRLPLEIGVLREIHIHLHPDGTLGTGPKSGSVLSIRKDSPKHAYVETHQEGIEINSHRVGIGKHSVIPGATSFQFGEYRLTWE